MQVASEVLQEVVAGSPAACQALQHPDAVTAFQQVPRLWDIQSPSKSWLSWPTGFTFSAARMAWRQRSCVCVWPEAPGVFCRLSHSCFSSFHFCFPIQIQGVRAALQEALRVKGLLEMMHEVLGDWVRLHAFRCIYSLRSRGRLLFSERVRKRHPTGYWRIEDAALA